MTDQNQRHLGNIGVFDARNASEEAIRAIGSVGNVGLFVTSADTAHLASQIRTGNVGARITALPEAKFVNSGLTIGANHFKDRQSPEAYLVNGRVLIEHGVSSDDLDAGLEAIYVNGGIFYPRALESVVQSKLQWHNGSAFPYDDEDVVEEGRLTLDEGYLESLNDNSNIMVIGRLDMPEVVPNELLERKIQSLKITGLARFHEENQRVLQSRVQQISRSAQLSVIPSGFQLYEMPVDLNDVNLQSLTEARMFVDDRAMIERGTDPALLDSAISAIRTTDILIYPEELSDVVARKCDLLQTRATPYRGELWLVEDEMDIVPSRFEFMEGNATLVVRGDVYVSPEVEPKTLADRFEAVHNFGDIHCSQDQMGAIQARMRTSEGDFHEHSERGTQGDTKANYGYLAL